MSDRTIQRIITRVANRVHVKRKVTPHVLRHMFAVTAIQRLLGHDRLTTTEIYLNLSP